MCLNLSQQEAIKCVNRPCLILAGAGSGKTKVIINKISYLIRKCGYEAQHIAALTFTNKASNEMKLRLAKELGSLKTRKLTVSTFHMLGLTIIKKEYQTLGINSKFSLFDAQDQKSLLNSLSEQWFKGNKELIQSLMLSISNWKNDLLSPEQANNSAISQHEKLFAHCYALYQNYLRSCNILDFDDLILRPIQLLKRNKEVRKRWEEKINYLLIDEYQDTNPSQYELIKLLVGSKGCFTVVGDDDQSIYSWRGARPKNLELLQQDFQTLQVIKLEQNYRSTKRILNAANILISNNPHFLKKRLFSLSNYGDILKVIDASNEEDEAEKVIKKVITHHFIKKTRYQDYAILYRSNHQSRLFEKILIKNYIPYRISGGTSFFSRPEIKDLLAYLRVLINPNDNSAFLRIVNTPRREIGTATLAKLGNWATQRNKSLFSASFDIGLEQKLKGINLKFLKNFTIWLQKIAKQAEIRPIEALHELIIDIDYKNWLYEVSTTSQSADIRIKNVNQLCTWVTEMLTGSELQEAMTLDQIITQFTLRDIMENNNDCDEERDQVKLMTLHASKGLEFPYVFLVGMEEGLLPHHNSISDNNIEEERRLTYVGITRAQKELTFTLCRERCHYGKIVKQTPSRFLFELPKEDIEWRATYKSMSDEMRITQAHKHLSTIRDQLSKARNKSD
ncbi:ATP-dependent DNA helicase Rep [secondary endosymbiont of Heteropsylla cubana]|uniref:ATP-dependent DNA helicase Rep n=1 Tax=secondary endosymbiont of Heteropsylla cubana TaxID=134287 RepID=J3VUI0_9ENTR|nr:DNA helicase Rep [secondary endosymbiont of Heteropsylla cubana]AFP85821.1 ATP-dependent DNA helicase Rep [secondary endosymbiont of Heteropsylla cubana]